MCGVRLEPSAKRGQEVLGQPEVKRKTPEPPGRTCQASAPARTLGGDLGRWPPRDPSPGGTGTERRALLSLLTFLPFWPGPEPLPRGHCRRCPPPAGGDLGPVRSRRGSLHFLGPPAPGVLALCLGNGTGSHRRKAFLEEIRLNNGKGSGFSVPVVAGRKQGGVTSVAGQPLSLPLHPILVDFVPLCDLAPTGASGCGVGGHLRDDWFSGSCQETLAQQRPPHSQLWHRDCDRSDPGKGQ